MFSQNDDTDFGTVWDWVADTKTGSLLKEYTSMKVIVEDFTIKPVDRFSRSQYGKWFTFWIVVPRGK